MKVFRKILSAVLACSLLAAIALTPVKAATEVQEETAVVEQSFGQRLGSKALGGLIKTLLTGLNAVFPDAKKFIDKEDFDTEKDFYKGTGTMLSAPEAGARWKLGYAAKSLVPDDWQEHTYYLGGYISAQNGFTNKVEGVIDDMEARIIAIEDGSGRGISVFATCDCIGMTNGDIKNIRAAVAEKAKESGYKFASINVASTHAHSGIDTEGLWTNLFVKVLLNIPMSLLRIDKLRQGTDAHYMEFLTDTISDGMIEACDSMVTGEMKLATKTLDPGYFNNKNRPSATSLDSDMTRLTFIPDEEDVTPTMIINIAAHPDVAGLPTESNSGREICGEYVYYMGETLANAGYNCMFFNGAIAGIYMGRGLTNNGQDLEERYMQSERYGRELGRMALSLTKTVEEIKADPAIYSEDVIAQEKAIAEKNGSTYRLWFENWEPVEEETVAPLLNVLIKQVYVPVTNPFIQLAGKLNLANYAVLKAGFKKYEICVEIGYMEFGDSLKVVMMPGEICQDLINGGGSLTAAGSVGNKDFGYDCIHKMFNDDSIICFGLMNDAIGYVVPDNDYCMSIAWGHYHELISLGNKAGSAIMQGFKDISENLTYTEPTSIKPI